MLSLELLLLEHLKTIDGFHGVDGISELMDAEEAQKKSPRLYLVFDGASVVEITARGRGAKIKTHWLIVVSIRAAGKMATGALARDRSVALVDSVLGACLGWLPQDDARFTPLVLEDAPKPDYAFGTYLVPLRFSSTQFVTAHTS